LAHLRPSRELLEYYRLKIGDFDNEQDIMLQRLDGYKATCEEQVSIHKIQWEIRQREEEISELQKALSDMQVYLFQEREHILRLYSENDRLKIRELDDRKKVATLLSISGLTESEVSYFMKEPPAKAIVQQKLPKKLQNELAAAKNNAVGLSGKKQASMKADEEREAAAYRKDNQTLSLQVEALQAQLGEQTKLAKEQIDALMEDRRVRMEEFETRRQRDVDKIQTLTEKLHKTQDLLHDSTQDLLSQRYGHRDRERDWMMEKDRFLRELDACKQELNISKDNDIFGITDESEDTRQQQEEEIQSLKYELNQAQKLGHMYREQVIQLEDKLSRIREEGEVGKDLFKERSEKMTKRLDLMNQRYADLERRRNLEVEGFKNDIKLLRGRLKAVEKQLFKVPSKRPDDVDMQILRNVRRTAGHSKELMGELKSLKGKVYGLENELRHL
ncbi:hypothetical protein CAPTEDRAFT_147477, partial [Capitella teleta]